MKERMKSILFVLALALVFVGAAKMTEAKAAVTAEVKYNDETVVVKGATGSVYYQVVKDKDAAVKAANWVPAALGTDEYLIDISALSNTKDSCIAYATSPDAEKEEGFIDVVAKIKSVKATLNYKGEAPANLYDVIAKLDVKGVAKQKADDRVWPDTTTGGKWSGKEELSDLVTLGWKRGANGAWDVAGNFDKVDWQMMKSSNTTLYLRVEGIDLDADGAQESYRYSKEAKVKVPKTAKAPSVKVDYKKGTVAIKNGMEFRKQGDPNWVTVGIKDKNAAATGSAFNVEKTALAKSSVTMAELKAQLGLNAGQEYTLEIRTSATDKKFMSNIKELKITLPVVAPTISATGIVAVSGDIVTFDFTKLNSLGTTTKYEYALVKSGSEVDLAGTKFTELAFEKLDVNKDKKVSFKVIESGKSKSSSIKYSEVDTLLVREIGEYKNAPLKFAGEVATVKLK